jgi:Asp-tRNA(Asn)/Glu-tRNA(Gln) amidotransferase A subunit family amidase
VGYIKSAFEAPKPFEPSKAPMNESAEAKKKREEDEAQSRAFRAMRIYDFQYEAATLDRLRKMGVTLIPVELPKLPYGAMTRVLDAEAAAAFDDLTMSGRDKLLTEQGEGDWPNTFRTARFYPAVEYIQASRARSIAIAEVSKLFEQVDVIVAPSGGMQLTVTNLTGHPALIVPNGLRGDDAPKPYKNEPGDYDNVGGPGTPVSITFLAGHYQDAKLCAFGRAYQEATGFQKLHPKLD